MSIVRARFFSKSPFSKISVTFAFTSKSAATGFNKKNNLCISLAVNSKSWVKDKYPLPSFVPINQLMKLFSQILLIILI